MAGGLESVSSVTTSALLEGLKDVENGAVWEEFIRRYRPMIFNYARKGFALSAHDAEDATQEALNAFFRAYSNGKYDPARGRLRKWLFGIATNKIRDFVRREAGRREVGVTDPSSGTGFLLRIPDEATLERRWMSEWHRVVYNACLIQASRQLSSKTIRAYEMLVNEKRPANQIATELRMSRNAVYLAKHKVIKRIRELLPAVEQSW